MARVVCWAQSDSATVFIAVMLSAVNVGRSTAHSAEEARNYFRTVRVVAIRFVSHWAKPSENRKGLEKRIREAAKRGAKIVVLPEAAIPAYMSHDISSLPDIARKSDLNIIGANWSVPDRPGWHGYGQSEVISRTGQVLARAKNDLGDEILYADLPIP